MSESLSPRDQAERVALFRAELIGAVSRRELSRGELAGALRALAAERYLPPGSKTPTAPTGSRGCAPRRAPTGAALAT